MNDHAGGGPLVAGFHGGSPGRRRGPLPTRVDQTPELLPAYDRALDAGLAAIPLALEPAARAAIATHARLLLAWNEAINLTSITLPEAVATLHVVDSLTAAPLIARRAAWLGRATRLLDIGSGAGYPGLVLAAAIPALTVVLTDSVAKKARFLETAAAATELGPRVTVAAERVEAFAPRVRAFTLEPFDVVTARAIASLADLVELSFPILAIGGALVAWKRGDIDAEVTAARRALDALGGGSISVEDAAVPGLAEHRLVVVQKTGATPNTYPRDPGRRRRARW
jgi:16S rRNA (guanine527-N7)-methyltransferase